MSGEIERLKRIISESDNIVFFGGAGMSTESGIPDFRSVDGLYNQQYKYPPETILSYSFFMREPEEYYRFHRAKLVIKNARPNAAHYKLAELEREGKVRAVVTQNIDGLHQMAGSRNVIELHGSASRFYCMSCGNKYSPDYVNDGEGVPYCECGGVIRPDVVLYEEALNDNDISSAVRYISAADVLIIGGTSLVVYPAAGLVNFYKGNKLVIVNKGETGCDSRANLRIDAPLGVVFSQL